jgi:hypothetical protein
MGGVGVLDAIFSSFVVPLSGMRVWTAKLILKQRKRKADFPDTQNLSKKLIISMGRHEISG